MQLRKVVMKILFSCDKNLSLIESSYTVVVNAA